MHAKLCSQVVRHLTPSSNNAGKRLVKAPKIYVRDSCITHALLDLQTLNDMLGHRVTGASYERFVIENIIQCAGPRLKPSFYRTQAIGLPALAGQLMAARCWGADSPLGLKNIAFLGYCAGSAEDVCYFLDSGQLPHSLALATYKTPQPDP